MKKVIALFSIILTMVSCESISNVANKVNKNQASILSTEWVLADNVKGKSPSLAIGNGKVSGNAGCNSYNGELTLVPESGTFSVKGIATTRMMCDNITAEQNFLSMLSSANRYSVSGNVLELYKDNLLLMKFNKQ